MNNPTAITPDEYFDEDFDLKDRDIGRPKELTIRTQKFKATLWMCEEFPLSLVEQVIPIIDLMARTSAHFARLRDFIKLDFPPGFPVKIGMAKCDRDGGAGVCRFCLFVNQTEPASGDRSRLRTN